MTTESNAEPHIAAAKSLIQLAKDCHQVNDHTFKNMLCDTLEDAIRRLEEAEKDRAWLKEENLNNVLSFEAENAELRKQVEGLLLTDERAPAMRANSIKEACKREASYEADNNYREKLQRERDRFLCRQK